MSFSRNFWNKFSKRPDPLLDLDGSELKPQRNVTIFLKDATSPCRSCGGPCAVFIDTNSGGLAERIYMKCPKCGESMVLTSKQPEKAAEIQRLINMGIVR